MPLSVLIPWIFFSSIHFGHSLLKAVCPPLQLGHFASLLQSPLFPVWPHLAQVSVPLHALLPWPNFWHLKQRRGFGIYRSTGTLMYPTVTCFGTVGSRNVTTNVFVLLLPPELSLTEMFSILTTPWDFISARTSCFSQSTSGLHLIIPLQVLRVRCGLAVTGQPARLFSLVTAQLCVPEETSIRISPLSQASHCLDCANGTFRRLIVDHERWKLWCSLVRICAMNYKPPIVMTTGSLFTFIIIHVCDWSFLACESCSGGNEFEEKSML